MSINTENYTDCLVTKAHIGFLLLVVLGFISKEKITPMQSTSTIFIAIALPLLAIGLPLLPSTKPEVEIPPRYQCILAAIAFVLGHIFGLLAFATILFDFNNVAGVLFLAVSLIALLIFINHTKFTIGKDGYKVIDEYIFNNQASSDQNSESDSNNKPT